MQGGSEQRESMRGGHERERERKNAREQRASMHMRFARGRAFMMLPAVAECSNMASRTRISQRSVHMH